MSITRNNNNKKKTIATITTTRTTRTINTKRKTIKILLQMMRYPSYFFLKAEVESLRKQVELLTAEMEEVKSTSAITSRTNDLLVKEIDRLEQHGRRHSVVIRGVPHKKDKTDEELVTKVRKVVAGLDLVDEFKRDFDKTHRIGPVFDGKEGEPQRQDVILRFKSHSTRYEVYKRRKTPKNGIRIAPSLTNKPRKMLKQARESYENHELIDFIFSDQHGDLKVKFKEDYKGKLFHPFFSIDELSGMIDPPDEDDGEL